MDRFYLISSSIVLVIGAMELCQGEMLFFAITLGAALVLLIKGGAADSDNGSEEQ